MKVMSKHIGIVAVSAEGARSVFAEIIAEGKHRGSECSGPGVHGDLFVKRPRKSATWRGERTSAPTGLGGQVMNFAHSIAPPWCHSGS
jgi:hypothetical protein